MEWCIQRGCSIIVGHKIIFQCAQHGFVHVCDSPGKIALLNLLTGHVH